MSVTPKPWNETTRLLALRSYVVLDTPSEPAFDNLARLASYVLEVPIAMISLVDAEREWVLAQYGVALHEIPRDISLASHIVATGEPLVIGNTWTDQRFARNPLVLGEPRIGFYAGAPLSTKSGEVLGAVCMIDHNAREITMGQLEMLKILAEQVIAQLEVRRSRLDLINERAAARDIADRLTMVFDAMNEGVMMQEADSRITYANRAAGLILSVDPSALYDRTTFEHPWRYVREDGHELPNHDHPVVVSLRTGLPVRNTVVGIHKFDGSLTWISISAVPRTKDGKISGVVTTFHDITALRKATELATQQERLATVGTLAAGVGHEINNPLAYILGNLDYTLSELATMSSAPSAQMQEIMSVLAEAREGADRIRKIVRGLRALAREDVALIGVPVAPVVEMSLSMAAHEVRSKAHVVTTIEDGATVLGDESRLTQILVNLLVNAGQAFEEANPARNEISITATTAADSRMGIYVRDNGPGIPAPILSRIFDPFFTTKGAGQGTGLGLSVSRNLVDALGGELLVQSKEGEGTTFSILLPLASQATPEANTAAATIGPRARIMVVDDEIAVVNTIRRILARDHDVTTFNDSRLAASSLAAGDVYDLIFCDLMMPYYTGQELYVKVVAERPGLADRFVFITAGATNPNARAFLAGVKNDRIEKPFAVEKLLSVAARFAKAR
ncbi:MAG: response regulator [Clostridia bacterium]|nr:response regulator [Deltaproteobacteria bacterium]